MNDPMLPRIGGILSADIAVPEHERETRFYSRVLTTGENPLWRDDLLNNRAIPIIGLGQREPENAHIPLQWIPHIQIVDVAASVERTLDLNGKVLMHAKDDQDKSQWAVLMDPNGAAFGVIPFVPAEAFPTNENANAADASAPVGCIAWLDLTVSDALATSDFYCEVVGWSAQSAEMHDRGERYDDYTMSDADGNPTAGICHARGVNQGLPATWLIYLPVGNLADSVQHAEAQGGKVIKATWGKDGEYAYAVIQDPVGVSLALAQG